jgi:hypothetical protein
MEVFDLSLCCNITFITQSPEEQKADELMTTNNGRDNWVTVPLATGFSLRKASEEDVSEDVEMTTSVSKMEIFKGSETLLGKDIEC